MNLFTLADYQLMKDFFSGGNTRSYAFRRHQLLRLQQGIRHYEQEIIDALYADLHKSPEEAYTTEIGFVYTEITHALKHLQQWMQSLAVSSPISLFPSSGKIIRDPLGICLIIAPWNYPFNLLMAPLIGAIAGGNCTVLKPSELAPHTSAIVTKLISEFFERKYIAIVEGDGSTVVPKLMTDIRFDHVFFTGSTVVGKIIAKLAAEKLVPYTLELGGKSPCIVAQDANVDVAAKRIAWGKFTNAGQTCVAPDYVMVHESKKDSLVNALQKAIQDFYGHDPQQSYDYGRIINAGRFEKLTGYLQEGSIITGGQTSKENLYIAPTLMEHMHKEATSMQEEIFGPILPIFSYKNDSEVLERISEHANPLAFYLFTSSSKTEKLYMDEVQFGGGCINNTLMHLGNAALPFGGVGNSGVGAYHGKFSFDTFTRPKSILKTATWFDPTVKYPPYKGKLKFLKWIFK